MVLMKILDVLAILMFGADLSVITGEVTVGDVLKSAGEQEIKDLLTYRTAQVSKTADYESTKENIMRYWMRLALFMIVFAALAVISLEFVDKDKR